MGVYKTTYIDKDASPEDVVSIFGALLHNLNEIMNRLTSDNIRSITTDRTTVKSEDGTTSIDGSQIVMLDGNGKKRMILGYNSKNKNFEFSLFNADGSETLKLSDSGDAVFKGNIEGSKITGSEIDVDKDITVGNNIYIAPHKSNGVKKIHFFDDETNSVIKEAYIEAETGNDGTTTLTIMAGNLILKTLGEIKTSMLLGNYKVVTTNMTPYIEIDGVKHYIKWEE